MKGIDAFFDAMEPLTSLWLGWGCMQDDEIRRWFSCCNAPAVLAERSCCSEGHTDGAMFPAVLEKCAGIDIGKKLSIVCLMIGAADKASRQG